MSKAIDSKDIPQMKFFINQCESFLNDNDLLTDEMKGIMGGTLGRIYSHLGNYKKSRKLLELNLANYKENYEENHTETARVLLDLGQVYLKEGKYDIAERYIHQPLLIFQQKQFPDSYLCFEALWEIDQRKSIELREKGEETKNCLYFFSLQTITIERLP